ncbi:MAG: hypothetical protein L3J47_09970 [Sulfurovum sp.]|nr:hypothetical protein [Sulfurovum sp.]
MYTVSHYQGYDLPTDIELLESYEGEAREIILQSFIDDGMLSGSVYAINETDEEEIEIEVSEWLNVDEVAILKALEKNATDAEWDAMTVQTLTQLLNTPTIEREAA